MPHLTRQTRDCSGQHELCCINQHRHNNILVNVFSHQEKKVQNMFRHKKKHLFDKTLWLDPKFDTFSMSPNSFLHYYKI